MLVRSFALWKAGLKLGLGHCGAKNKEEKQHMSWKATAKAAFAEGKVPKVVHKPKSKLFYLPFGTHRCSYVT